MVASVVALSISIAYLVAGWSYATQALQLPRFEQPILALKHPIRYLLLHMFMWPVFNVRRMCYGHQRIGRGVCYGVLSSILQLSWMSAAVWGTIAVIMMVTDTLLIQLIVGVAIIPSALILLAPLGTLISFLFMLPFGAVIELVFPLKE